MIMNKTVAFLIIIMIPVQGIAYSMPVPSEASDEAKVPVHGGGMSWFWDIFSCAFIPVPPYALSICLFLASGCFLLDDDKDNDLMGVAFGAFGGLMLYVDIDLQKESKRKKN